ncbi:MAG TPA: translocation/assembly module TamB domain-containing protein, partial [Novosphingobium sp.]|nr:translocation/assembly module TamB domain-containing protein [Novosphingobium sp.]
AAPRVGGQAVLIPGTLDIAGRYFTITEGRISFTDGTASDPAVALLASEDIDDVSVRVRVTGRASDPQVAFSSVPSLPQDEVLSRILFGRAIGNLSAVQSLQLAASLNALRTGGAGLNPLGRLRSATGVDRLSVLAADEANGRGTALALGQYLTKDIYVEFVTDARGFTATQIEVSLNRALSIISQAGGSGATDVQLRYRKNY